MNDSFRLPDDVVLGDGSVVPGAIADPRTIKTIGICQCFLCGKVIALPDDQFMVDHSAGFPLYAHRLCLLAKHALLVKIEYLSAVQDIALKRRITQVAEEVLKLRGGS